MELFGMKSGQITHSTGLRVAAPGRNRLTLGYLPLSIVVLLNGLPFSPACAEVYTGTNAHGIRWYSDTAPVQGPYQVVTSSIPRLEAEPAVVSPSPNMAAEGDASATSKRKTKPKSQRKPSRKKAAAKPAKKSKAKSVSSLPSSRVTAGNVSRSNKYRNFTQHMATQSKVSPRKPRRPAMSQRARQAAALQRRCQRYDLSLRKIQSELRAGYRAAQGRKLRQRRKELQALQFAECPIR